MAADMTDRPEGGMVRGLLGLLSPRSRSRLIAGLRRPRPTLGNGAFVHSSVHLIGALSVRIGGNSVVSEDTWLNVNSATAEGQYAIDIHRNCFVGKRNFFSSGAAIELLPYVLTTVDCKFIGSSHRIADPSVPFIASGTSNDASIRIGVNCFVGAGAAVMGNVMIGHGSVIGAMAFVTADVPPFSIAIGNPARVVKRYSHAASAWLPVDSIAAADVASMPDENLYLQTLDRDWSELKMPYPAAARDMGHT